MCRFSASPNYSFTRFTSSGSLQIFSLQPCSGVACLKHPIWSYGERKYVLLFQCPPTFNANIYLSIYLSLFSIIYYQTQIFHTLYHSDRNVLVGAPTGSGKTVLKSSCTEGSIERTDNVASIYYIPVNIVSFFCICLYIYMTDILSIDPRWPQSWRYSVSFESIRNPQPCILPPSRCTIIVIKGSHSAKNFLHVHLSILFFFHHFFPLPFFMFCPFPRHL